ncbi:GNAT family N-acetyltransferase [Leifsonia shinshuensis]|uniref:GNAT family N-acetyltransferase n=1 Tax=Leifsonia shinshuensis TaxID=150026 RepID=UPI001F5084C4|nr:GNAT family N-acetyltransferase [Leifsonia shinshuensis]MCI0159006.1 GNAT family N-acetyltransferase [Leifsonia shinshuensis]
MGGLEFAPAREDDVAGIEALVREAYEPYVERIGAEPGPLLDDYRAIVADGRATVVRRDGAVVALLVMSVAADHVLVENVAVAESERGGGLGGRLLDLADERARAAGVGEVRLYTNAAMTENLAYYPRRGFRETGRRVDGRYSRVFFSRRVDRGDR